MSPCHPNAIQLNTLAVEKLQDGDFDSASHLIEMALQCTMGRVIKDTSMQLVQTSFSWSNEAPIAHRPGELIFGYLHAQGIIIKSKESTVLTRECQAAIFYNSAVIEHLRAASQREQEKFARLHRAKVRYILVRRILKICSQSMLLRNLHIHLAILNNLGQLSYELLDYNTNQICYNQLRKGIAVLNKGGYDAFEKHQIIGMATNVLLETPISAPCA